MVQPQPTQTVVIKAPAAPSKVRAVRHGDRVKVTWRAVVGATSYVARCGKVSEQTTRVRVQLATQQSRAPVRAVNTAGTSPWVKAAVEREARPG